MPIGGVHYTMIMTTPSGQSQALFALLSLALSRILFSLVNDPEGPNLLIVVFGAACIYLVGQALTKLVYALVSHRR